MQKLRFGIFRFLYITLWGWKARLKKDLLGVQLEERFIKCLPAAGGTAAAGEPSTEATAAETASTTEAASAASAADGYNNNGRKLGDFIRAVLIMAAMHTFIRALSDAFLVDSRLLNDVVARKAGCPCATPVAHLEGGAFVYIWNYLHIVARWAFPYVVVDALDAFFGVLGGSEVFVVVYLIDFHHLRSAVGTLSFAVAPVAEHYHEGKRCYKRKTEAEERSGKIRRAQALEGIVFLEPVLFPYR